MSMITGRPLVKGYLARIKNGDIEGLLKFQFNPTEVARSRTVDYNFTAPPTSINTLERAYDIGRGSGLQYVYIGNMPGHPSDNTHCPNCGEVIILRQGFSVFEYHLLGAACKYCETTIPGVWWSEKPEGGLVSTPPEPRDL